MVLVYCLHGDELMTEKVAKELQYEFGEIEIVLGNPVARESEKRFIESDLNRSFNSNKKTAEAKRAKELIKILGGFNDNLIIDLHTTKANMPPVAIVTDLSQIALVSRLGMDKAIYMPPQFSSGGSLIENVSNAVSIEFFADADSKSMVKNFIRSAYAFDSSKIDELEVYFVEEIVKGRNDPEIENFRKLRDGSYPVFSGEPAYKGVKYLKTRKKRISLTDLKAD